MKLFLDAGHGGRDSGATNINKLEKDDTLKLTMCIGRLAQAKGIDVNYSRTDDSCPSLYERTAKANGWGADLYLSIHRNSASPSANGVETWIVHNAKKSTIDFGNKINNSIAKYFRRDRGVKKGYVGNPKADFHINRETNMLSALLEIGFITNENDNEIFDFNVEEIATSIVDTVCEYYNIKNNVVETPAQSQPQQQPQNNTVTVKKGTWNLRAEPSNNGKIVDVLNGGTVLEYNGITPDGWYSIANRGFIHRNCLIV